MAQETIQHDGREIDVEIIDEESWGDDEYVQIQAVDDGTNLSDQSGEAPWVNREELGGA